MLQQRLFLNIRPIGGPLPHKLQGSGEKMRAALLNTASIDINLQENRNMSRKTFSALF
jgi:hypothetical protein